MNNNKLDDVSRTNEGETIEQKTYRLMQTIAGASPSRLSPQDHLLEIKESSAIFRKSCALIELAIAEEREACGWQTIESAPKDGTHILVLIPGSDIEKVVSWCDEPTNNEHKDGKGVGWRMSWDNHLFCGMDQPTCWHLLPAIPKDEVSE